jgi:hypothetical protein
VARWVEQFHSSGPGGRAGFSLFFTGPCTRRNYSETEGNCARRKLLMRVIPTQGWTQIYSSEAPLLGDEKYSFKSELSRRNKSEVGSTRARQKLLVRVIPARRWTQVYSKRGTPSCASWKLLEAFSEKQVRGGRKSCEWIPSEKEVESTRANWSLLGETSWRWKEVVRTNLPRETLRGWKKQLEQMEFPLENIAFLT